jgi:hypothetical protein
LDTLVKTETTKDGLSVFWFEYFIKICSQFIAPRFFIRLWKLLYGNSTQNNEHNNEASRSFLKARFPENVKKSTLKYNQDIVNG